METTQRQEEKKAMRVYLKATDFDTHGYTDGCDGCAKLQAGMDPRPHTETETVTVAIAVDGADSAVARPAPNRNTAALVALGVYAATLTVLAVF